MRTEIKEKLKQAVMDYSGELIYFSSAPLRVGKSSMGDESIIKRYHIEGLLCEVYMQEQGINWERFNWTHENSDNYGYTCLGHSHGTPKVVLNWAGVGNLWLDKIFYGLDEKKKEEILRRIEAL